MNQTTAKNTANKATGNSKTTDTGPRQVKNKGLLLDTQDCANLVGRNWQFINKLRSAGEFIDESAKCGNAFLYSKTKVLAWMRRRMTGVGGKLKIAA